MDQKTRNIITVYVGLHPKSSVEWFYLRRNKWSRACKHRKLCHHERQNWVLYAFRSYEKYIIAEMVELKLEKFINVQNKQERRNFSDRMERESSSLSVPERNRSTDDRNR